MTERDRRAGYKILTYITLFRPFPPTCRLFYPPFSREWRAIYRDMSNTGHIYLYIARRDRRRQSLSALRRGMRSTSRQRFPDDLSSISRGATPSLPCAPHRARFTSSSSSSSTYLPRLYFSPHGQSLERRNTVIGKPENFLPVIYLGTASQIRDFILSLEWPRARRTHDCASQCSRATITFAIHHHPDHENIVVDIPNYSDNHSLVNHPSDIHISRRPRASRGSSAP